MRCDIMNGLNLSGNLEIGVDFNVVSNPTTGEVLQSDSKYIADGEVITSFTIKDNNIVSIGHRRGVVDDDLKYCMDNIFNVMSPVALVELIEGMVDGEYKYVNGLKIIRLLNFYTS